MAAAERAGGGGRGPGAAPALPPPGTSASGPGSGSGPGPGSGAAASPPAGRPVRMSLFGAWEVDRGSPACVPRLLTLTLQRLALLRGGAEELGGGQRPRVVIAVRLQGSKRILRSSEISLPGGGAAETELQLTFSLQYPHSLKRGPTLQVLLQRPKRYKHRAFLRYKTLAVGLIDMAEVLQQPSEAGRVLVLRRAPEEAAAPVAEVRVRALCSQPVEVKGKRTDRSPDAEVSEEEEEEEEEEESSSSEQDASDDPGHPQDLFDEEEELPKAKKPRRKAPGGRHPNIKQKFVALLRRFRVSEEALVSRARMRAVAEDLAEDLALLCASLGIPGDPDPDPGDPGDPDDPDPDPDDPNDLDPDDPDGPDGGPSAPKPRLRPFFEGPSQTETGSEGTPTAEAAPKGARRPPEDVGPDPEGLDPRGDSEEPGGGPEKLRPPRKGSKGEAASPRLEAGGGRGGRRGTPLRERPPPGPDGEAAVGTQEQLSRALGPEGAAPDCVVLVGTGDWQGQWVAELLRARGLPLVGVATAAELQGAMGGILARVQRLCSRLAHPWVLKVAAVGGAGFQGRVLRCFVRHRPPPGPPWLRSLRFLLVPLGPHPVAQYLGALDGRYGAAFLDPPWRELFGRSEAPPEEPFDVAGRILTFLGGAGATQALPVAEAMLTCGHPFPDEDSCQKFVPFVGVVKVGLDEDPPSTTGDGDEAPPPSLAVPSTSPPREAAATPPASPSMAPAGPPGASGDAVGLQVDYWGPPREGGAKSSVRGTFRSLHVSPLPPPPHAEGGAGGGPSLAMTLVPREKNKKVPALFLGKRPREPDPKSLVVDGITRLICAPRPPQALLTVSVDGTPWDSIKFFQLSAPGPPHAKHFPVGIFGTKPT